MGASNTPLYDLVELSSLGENRTFTTAPGGDGDIIGYVDNATYTDDENNNSATQITEINETQDADAGRLFIDGVEYSIQIVTPSSTSNPVTVTYDGGATRNLVGDDGTSQVAFIVATPLGGGSDRYFMAFDDGAGDMPGITSVQTRGLDWDPAGDDVKIDLDQNNNVAVCFAAGTSIDTPTGPRPVETIEVGDLVFTLDRGPRPVLWVGHKTLPLDNAMRRKRNAPVRFKRGAFGTGMPERDLIVSPHHRMFVASRIAGRMFGCTEILVPAKKLVGLPGVDRLKGLPEVTYCHLFLGTHEIVRADGAYAETLLIEAEARDVLGQTAQDALLPLGDGLSRPARPIIEKGPLVKELIRRHQKNLKPLVDTGLVEPHADAMRTAPPLRLVS
ncbi:Hint domain-containing protein [Maritimibacter alexandrii]|uniref:Hint domain-containing protein n=1 Tax=Maritimibacter alexandrii TaxID=2570355 RepID=UPI00110985FE|nr:Hint domain-containing protein [Maritimibacter alexandrii]